MDKGVGVALAGVGAEVLAFAGTAMFAAVLGIPCVLTSLVPYIAIIAFEGLGDAVLAVGMLGAIERAAAHLCREVGTGDTEELLGHDMVDALLQVGNLLLQPGQQPLGGLAQEDTALAAGVKDARLGAVEQLLRQQVEHPVGKLRRSEDLVAAQIGQAVENIRAIVVIHTYIVGNNGWAGTT